MSDRKRRYVVTGIHPVLGYQPGEEFTANIEEAQEAALLAGGGLSYAVDVESEKPNGDGKGGKP